MDLQWPVAAALLSILVVALLRSRAGGAVGWIAVLLLATPVLLILVPLVELMWVSLTFRALGLVAVLAAITLQLALAALDPLRQPNGWWAPLTGLVVCAAALGVGFLVSGPTAERPAPSTLMYVYEHGTGAAFWATDPNADPVLDEEARAWAVERAGAAFTETRDLSGFGYAPGEAPVASAPVVAAAAPEVAILRDTLDGERRHVILAVRSRIGAERLAFQRDSVGRTRFLSIDGIEVEQPGSAEWVTHWGVPDSMVVLELDMPADEPIGAHVVEDLLRPEELLGEGAFQRPPHLAPDVEARSDRALFRYSLAAFADPRHAFMPAPNGGAGPDGVSPGAEAEGPSAPGQGGGQGATPGNQPDTLR
jgi:hypothetical protein